MAEGMKFGEEAEGMSEEEAAEQFAALMEHPWVVPATHGMNPSPVPTNINLEPVELEFTGGEGEESTTVDTALLTICTSSGVTTIYISPPVLQQFIATGVGILQGWAQAQKQGLVVADIAMEQQARREHEAQQRLRKE